MTNPIDEASAQLGRDWRWEIWIVPRAVGGPVWCARRRADRDAIPARVLNADSPKHLAEYLEEASSR